MVSSGGEERGGKERAGGGGRGREKERGTEAVMLAQRGDEAREEGDLDEDRASGAGGEGRTQLRLSVPERKAPEGSKACSGKPHLSCRPPPQRERREEAVRRHAEREGPAEHHLFTARSCEDKSSSSHPQRSDRSSPRASEAAAAPQRQHPPPAALATRSHHPLLPLLRLPLPSPLQLRRSLRCAALPAALTRRGPVHRRESVKRRYVCV